MPKNQIRPTSTQEAIERAKRFVGGTPLMLPPEGMKPEPIKYKLGKGGMDPGAAHPAAPYKDLLGRWHWGVDCSAFVCHAIGLPKFIELFPHFGGWVATTSIWEAAQKDSGWFKFVNMPEPGDLVVYPNTYKAGIRVGIGHIGMVVKVGPDAAFWSETRVIHASGGASRRLGYAISETSAELWRRKGKFVRYLKAAPF